MLAFGVGFQAAMVIVASVVLTVVIVARIAQQPDSKRVCEKSWTCIRMEV